VRCIRRATSCTYLTRDGGLVPADAQFVELTEGNFLTSDAIAEMLAKRRGRSFNQVLDGLPRRDEGYPPDPPPPRCGPPQSPS